MKLFLIELLAVAFSLSAVAAVPARVPVQKPSNILAGESGISGGVAGQAFSLTDVTLAKLPQAHERVILDIGDAKGLPKKGQPGYYHVELQHNPDRLIIDLAQTPTVTIDDKKLNQNLRASNLISRSSILIDPTDQTLSVILELKKSTKAQVFQVAGKKGTSRVVVDLL